MKQQDSEKEILTIKKKQLACVTTFEEVSKRIFLLIEEGAAQTEQGKKALETERIAWKENLIDLMQHAQGTAFTQRSVSEDTASKTELLEPFIQELAKLKQSIEKEIREMKNTPHYNPKSPEGKIDTTINVHLSVVKQLLSDMNMLASPETRITAETYDDIVDACNEFLSVLPRDMLSLLQEEILRLTEKEKILTITSEQYLHQDRGCSFLNKLKNLIKRHPDYESPEKRLTPREKTITNLWNIFFPQQARSPVHFKEDLLSLTFDGRIRKNLEKVNERIEKFLNNPQNRAQEDILELASILKDRIQKHIDSSEDDDDDDNEDDDATKKEAATNAIIKAEKQFYTQKIFIAMLAWFEAILPDMQKLNKQIFTKNYPDMPPPRIRSEKEKYDKLLQGKKDSNYNTIQKEFLTLKNLYMNMDTNRFDTTLQAGYLLGDVYDFFLKKIYESYLLQKNEEEILKDKDITNELITCLVERKPIDNKRVL